MPCNQLCLNIFLLLAACEFHKEEEVGMDFWRPRNVAEFILRPGLHQPRCDASGTGCTNQSRGEGRQVSRAPESQDSPLLRAQSGGVPGETLDETLDETPGERHRPMRTSVS